MKERPIIFSAPMVQAILEGRKTQTRRVVKHIVNVNGHECLKTDLGYREISSHLIDELCPYGQVGDRLWVRETWCTHVMYDNKKPSELWQEKEFLHYFDDDVCGLEVGKTRPSIFMPRWASRITLEITNIRVERLKNISDEDSVAEGIIKRNWAPEMDAFIGFQDLWIKINGQSSWDENPWVWVVEFERVE